MLNAAIDEDTLMQQCQVALSFVDNLNKEYGNNSYLGNSNRSGFVEELQEHHSILRNSIEQFKTSESLGATMISHLKEALHEQELKMQHVRSQLQSAQSRYKKADDLCHKLGIHVARQEPSNQGHNKSSLSEVPVTFVPDSANADSLEKGQSTAVSRDSQEGDGGEQEILNGVLSSRAARDNVEQKIEEHSSGNKRQKLEIDVYQSQPPLPPLPHPDTYQPPPPPPQDPLPPESSPPPPPPLPTSMPFPIPPPPTAMPVPAVPMTGVPAVPMTGVPYGAYPSFTPVVNYPMSNMPPFLGAPNPRPSFQGLGGPSYGPPPYSAAPPPMSRK